MAQVSHHGEWTSGFCDCFSDCELCLITYFFPCITVGRIVKVADRGQSCE
ncbi:hypothetical protein KP509_1Z315500 [Ceratopteris richardii]|nr:hypothetical protein KP509_1Z315500 [Ceratopteris richardii]